LFKIIWKWKINSLKAAIIRRYRATEREDKTTVGRKKRN
jgi:hypothetical protein